jgi:hypothetical protein
MEEIRDEAAAVGAARRPWRRVLRRANIFGFSWFEWAIALPRFQWREEGGEVAWAEQRPSSRPGLSMRTI